MLCALHVRELRCSVDIHFIIFEPQNAKQDRKEILILDFFTFLCVITANMHLYSEEHTVYGDYAFEEWDPELVADLLDRVNPYNMRLDLVTKSFDKNASGKNPFAVVRNLNLML